MIAIDTTGVLATDEFVQIENSIDKPLIDTTDIKNAHKYAKAYILTMEPFDSDWKGNSPKLIGKPVPYYTDDTNEPI